MAPAADMGCHNHLAVVPEWVVGAIAIVERWKHAEELGDGEEGRLVAVAARMSVAASVLM